MIPKMCFEILYQKKSGELKVILQTRKSKIKKSQKF